MEVITQVKSLRKLESAMNFHFLKQVQIEYYSLQVDNQYVRNLV